MFTRRGISVVLTAVIVLTGCAGTGPTTRPPTSSPAGSASASSVPSTSATATSPATASTTPAPSASQSSAPSVSAAPPPSAEPSVSTSPVSPPPATASPEPSVSEACTTANLTLKNPGRLTLSTDNPAFPPWWGGDPETQYPNEPEGGSGWDFSDPYSMEGYESAISYAVADTLGFTPDQVDWIQNVRFANAFQPGPKDFDFHLAQISIRPGRAENVDFSEPYFQANQSLLAIVDTPIAEAASIDELKEFRLGAAVGTTSFELIESVIVPTAESSVFDDNEIARRALQNGQIDGLIVDLQTAFFMRDVQTDGQGVVVGQFDVAAQADPVGIVLELDSPLTACVNEALAVMEQTGVRQGIYDQWISTGQEVPFFE